MHNCACNCEVQYFSEVYHSYNFIVEIGQTILFLKDKAYHPKIIKKFYLLYITIPDLKWTGQWIYDITLFPENSPDQSLVIIIHFYNNQLFH